MNAYRIAVFVFTVVIAVTANADSPSLHEQLHLRGFIHPTAAFDAGGNIFIADNGGNRIIKYSPAGDSLAAVSGSGWGETQFDGPCGIAVRGVDVFVADHGNHRIQRFDRTLNFIATLFTRESVKEMERFGYPRSVAVSQQGDLYVLDGENLRIVKFTPFNVAERSFGGTDAGTWRLIDPKCVTADATGLVMVVDAGTVKRFDTFGTPHGVFSVPQAQWCSSEGDKLYILTDATILRFSSSDPEAAQVSLPAISTWRGMTASPDRIALWTDTDVITYSLHP